LEKTTVDYLEKVGIKWEEEEKKKKVREK